MVRPLRSENGIFSPACQVRRNWISDCCAAAAKLASESSQAISALQYRGNRTFPPPNRAHSMTENTRKKQGAGAWFIVAPARITRSLGIVITLAVCALFLAANLAGFEVPLLDQLEAKTYDMRMRAQDRLPPRFVTI